MSSDLPSLVATVIGGFTHHHYPLEHLMQDRIHYGCGGHVKNGWLNVDGFDGSYPYSAIQPQDRPRIFCLDLTGRHPFADETFAFGYSEHMLEHLDQADSLIFLSEVYRTLKPGGVLRICCPGFAGILRRHYRGSHFDGAVTGRHEAFQMWGHRHYYCIESLALAGRHLGFSNVYEVAHGQSSFPVLTGAESRPRKEDGFELIVELVK